MVNIRLQHIKGQHDQNQVTAKAKIRWQTCINTMNMNTVVGLSVVGPQRPSQAEATTSVSNRRAGAQSIQCSFRGHHVGARRVVPSHGKQVIGHTLQMHSPSNHCDHIKSDQHQACHTTVNHTRYDEVSHSSSWINRITKTNTTHQSDHISPTTPLTSSNPLKTAHRNTQNTALINVARTPPFHTSH